MTDFFTATAKYDLPLAESCDEDDEKSYCASGLICRRCPNDAHNKCVRCKLNANEY